MEQPKGDSSGTSPEEVPIVPDDPKTPPARASRVEYSFSGPRPQLVSPSKKTLFRTSSLEDRRAAFLSGTTKTDSPAQPELLSYPGYSHLFSPPQTLSPGNDVPMCNCKHSKCLKLYCNCFAAGVACTSACKCSDCYNDGEHDTEKITAIKRSLFRNSRAFYPKVIRGQRYAESVADTEKTMLVKGCNCRRTKCLKRYCECFQAGVHCTDLCRCVKCCNLPGLTDLTKLQMAPFQFEPPKPPYTPRVRSVVNPRVLSDFAATLLDIAGSTGDDVLVPEGRTRASHRYAMIERAILTSLHETLTDLTASQQWMKRARKNARIPDRTTKKRTVERLENEAVLALSALKHFTPPTTPGDEDMSPGSRRHRTPRSTRSGRIPKRRKLEDEILELEEL